MSEQWDGKVFMSTPGGPVVTMSLGHVLARQDAEIKLLRAEVERLRAVLDRLARLGNEPAYGNSFGNVLARKALEAKP